MKGFLKIFFISFFVFYIFLTGDAYASSAKLTESFFVDPEFSKNGQQKVKATLRYTGNKAYFYVDNAYFNTLNSKERGELFNFIKKLSSEYDNKIYPTLTEKIGKIREPGIDNENKIYVLFLELKDGAGGYINTADGYPYELLNGLNTNEKELIYLNVDLMLQDRAYGFFAHEFQHLISFNNKEIKKNINEDVWFNELKSEYAIDILGYNIPFEGSFLESRSSSFIENPNDPLTEWKGDALDYSSVSLLEQYISDNYNQRLFRLTTESNLSGIESINEALSGLGYSVSFSDIFSKWVIANFLNDKEKFGAEFGYLNENLNFNIQPTYSYEIFQGDKKNFSFKVKDWEPLWIKFFGDVDFLTFSFDSQKDDKFKVSYIIKKRDGSFLIKDIFLSDGVGALNLNNFKNDIEYIVLIPFSTKKVSGFSQSEPDRIFNISVSTKKQQGSLYAYEQVVFSLKNGTLVRPAWDYKVYVVKDNFIRYIRNEDILGFYGDMSDVLTLTREEFNVFKESFLVRAEGDYKVYEIDKNGVRHWLNMTADEFRKSGRSFISVFQISENELKLYKEGKEITI